LNGTSKAPEVRFNARIEVHDLSQILSNRLQTVSVLLQTLTRSSVLQNNTYKKTEFILFNTRYKEIKIFSRRPSASKNDQVSHCGHTLMNTLRRNLSGNWWVL